MTQKVKNKTNDKEVRKPIEVNEYKANVLRREHNEFHNCYTIESVKQDIQFLELIYGNRLGFSCDDVTQDFVNRLKVISKEVYFFVKTLEYDFTLLNYIKSKYEFIQMRIPNANPHLFYLAWNGLIKNDSFRRLLLQTFSLTKFNDVLCPQNIPVVGSSMTRYRTKLVIADDSY